MSITIEALETGYGRSSVLQGIDLAIDKGKITSILGANGAGKTTLLRSIAGLLPVRGGSISFKGQRLDKMSSPQIVASGIAHVPEGRQLFPGLTVEENVRLGGYAASQKVSESAALEAVFNDFPRVRERRQQIAGTLSGGEQQMVAIGRALMSNPSVLLLDEPSMGLAPKLVQQVLQIVRRLKESRGLTVVLVEQNARLALGLADKVFIMENGKIVSSGAPNEMKSEEIVKSFYLGKT